MPFPFFMSITLNDVSYIHPDKETLFDGVSLVVNKNQKVGLVGNNGSGKSTLLRIIGSQLIPSAGEIVCTSIPYYVPQHFGQYNDMTVASALGVENKIEALKAIESGDPSIENYSILNDDWTVMERSLGALFWWGLEHIQLDQLMYTLSGGEKTKVFLSGILIHSPSIILMDEPTNHLDLYSRKKLYTFIDSTHSTFIIVSHDITLLNTLPFIFELSAKGIIAYGGNYDFYKEQKEIQLSALHASLEDKDKELRAAKKLARETAERKQREDMRGKKRGEKKGIPRIMMNTLKDRAEKSTAKLKEVHGDKMNILKENIKKIQNSIPDNRLMKLDINPSFLHTGKILVTAIDINYSYGKEKLWDKSVSFKIRSGDRLSLQGKNGSGKTTLVKMITGQLTPVTGQLTYADFEYIYIDQEYSLICNEYSLLEQIEKYNKSNLSDHELKTLLNRFLFPHHVWNNKCENLSGGEKMRLMLCCLLVGNKSPDMIILDEPTNNLDIENTQILTSVIKNYQGSILVVSHDSYFLNQINIIQYITM